MDDSDLDGTRRALARHVPLETLDVAWNAYQEALLSGLCHEGAWEVAIGRARSHSAALPVVDATGEGRGASHFDKDGSSNLTVQARLFRAAFNISGRGWSN